MTCFRKIFTNFIAFLRHSTGKDVLVFSNDSQPMQRGIFISYDRNIPVVCIGDKTMLCMGIVVLFDNVLFNKMSSMSPSDQWEYVSMMVFSGQLKRL